MHINTLHVSFDEETIKDKLLYISPNHKWLFIKFIAFPLPLTDILESKK